MLKAERRNFKPYEVVRTSRKGVPHKSANFMVRYLAHDKVKKALVSVSTKFSKSAVKRNILRRKVYGVLEKIWENMPSGLFYISARPKGELSGEEILKELKELTTYDK